MGGAAETVTVAVAVLLPAALVLFDRKPRPERGALPHPTLTLWLPALTRRPWLVLGVGAGLLLLLGWGATRSSYDHNLLHLQDPAMDAVRWQQTLTDRLSGASWNAVSVMPSPETALALKERFERLPGVSQVETVAALVPDRQGEKLARLAHIHERLQKLPPRDVPIPHATPDVTRVTAQLVRELKRYCVYDPDHLPGERADK